jgi:hypothetical protein
VFTLKTTKREFGNCYEWGGNWKKPPIVASFNVQLTAFIRWGYFSAYF